MKKHLLYLSKLACYFDKKNNTLYIRQDGSTFKYSNLFKSFWITLKSSDDKLNYLNIVTSSIYPEPAVLPKGLDVLYIDEDEITMYEVDSSNIKAVGYNNSTLYIEYLNNDLYQYENVPLNYWEALKNADSKGSWIHWFIKINSSQFPYSKVRYKNIRYSVANFPKGTAHPSGYLSGF